MTGNMLVVNYFLHMSSQKSYMVPFFKLFLFVFVAMSQQKSAFHIMAVCQSVPFSCSRFTFTASDWQISVVGFGEESVVEPNSGAQTVCSLSLSKSEKLKIAVANEIPEAARLVDSTRPLSSLKSLSGGGGVWWKMNISSGKPAIVMAPPKALVG